MRWLYVKFIVINLIAFGITCSGAAQVNTEKFRKYSTKKGFLFNTTFRFGYSAGNSDYISFDGTARLDYNGKVNNAFVVANYDYKESSSEKIVNKGFVHLRGIHPFNDILSGEGFLQQEFDEFILLKDRKLAGTGVRIKIMDFNSKADTLSGLRSHLGLGLMYEHEIYGLPDDEEIKKETFRMTSYLTIDWKLTQRISFWAIGYYQPNVSQIQDFRGILDTGIEIWMIGKLYFSIDFSYRYNNEPVGDVKKYDLLFKNGLRLTIP